MQNFRLYLILDKKLCGNRDLFELAQAAIKGGVDMIQLRDKESAAGKIVDEAVRLRKLAQKENIIFIINDRVDIALAVDAHGVHLGEDDLPFNLARQILGKGKIIGTSVHNLAQAREAEEKGADYISVGAIFPTRTKSGADVVGVELIRKIATSIGIPSIAIGGINLNNIEEVVETGVKRIAVGEAILREENITRVAEEFKSRLSSLPSGA